MSVHDKLIIPADPGTYVLVLRCATSRAVRIGRLGSIRLPPGWYVYVGSAFGPGGLRARIGHHRKRAAHPHWHIDYLRRYTRLESVWYCCGVRREHEWAARIGAMPGAAIVLRGFGSSDCRCATHLYWFAESPNATVLKCVLGVDRVVVTESASPD
jgi:Uri superfamily endonuclease